MVIYVQTNFPISYRLEKAISLLNKMVGIFKTWLTYWQLVGVANRSICVGPACAVHMLNPPPKPDPFFLKGSEFQNLHLWRVRSTCFDLQQKKVESTELEAQFLLGY